MGNSQIKKEAVQTSFNNVQSCNFGNELQGKDRETVLSLIVLAVEKGAGMTLKEFKEKYSEHQQFKHGLKYVTTTKKALCVALGINVEAACRSKRDLEKVGLLVQSNSQVVCPYTKHFAHLISTNPMQFDSLRCADSSQLTIFDSGA